MDNPYLTRAISSTRKLQLLITKLVEFEKDLGIKSAIQIILLR